MMVKGATLPSDYETDPWVAAFICELHIFFGTPVTGIICKSKEDKLQYLWARIGIANALTVEESLWRAMKNKVNPEIAAEEFARRYFKITNKMIIEQVPYFSPKSEEPRALVDSARQKVPGAI